ncbi:MAG: hypothetical protein JXR25_03565 [Pontiellaceae bacterium]|nr:hypothetical protein [Pontiellaceae bacterium]MBN2783880.1 hypothetical protein [Pontiellaceae bacterium]
MDLNSSETWRSWNRALLDDGFNLRIFDPGEIESAVATEHACNAVLIDDHTEMLAAVIMKIRARCPTATICIVSERHIFSCFYEAVQSGVAYISEPSSPQNFVSQVQKMLGSITLDHTLNKVAALWGRHSVI